ncbi:MAG: protein phosphatase 2C domain-containing protein [Myxococcota bacterium]|nr:protein phosphatase 2C domain-containing protein [Myxococcota bacterium]
MRPGLQLGNASDVGRDREANEDYFGYAEPASDEAWRAKGRLLIVSDGMGGAAGGAVASRLVVETVCARYVEEPPGDPREALRAAIEAANQLVHRRAQEEPDLRGMGATATAVAIVDGVAHIAHVGDTRAYLVRGQRAVQLTDDQSLVARMVREGVISAEEAKDHPKSNVIEQAVGQKPTIVVDTSVPSQRLEPGDAIVLCTDGLHGLVSGEEIAQFVAVFPPAEAAKHLVDLANGRGGPDNITVQIALLGAPRGAASWLARAGASGGAPAGWRVLPAVALASLVLAAVAGGLVVYGIAAAGRGQATSSNACPDVASSMGPDTEVPAASRDAGLGGAAEVPPVTSGSGATSDQGQSDVAVEASEELPDAGGLPDDGEVDAGDERQAEDGRRSDRNVRGGRQVLDAAPTKGRRGAPGAAAHGEASTSVSIRHTQRRDATSDQPAGGAD